MVAEKPSVAKELAAILSNGSCSSKTGESPYNRLFEYNGQLDGASVPTVMTSVAGHLMGLDFDKSYKKWEGCDPTSLLVEAPLVWSVQDSLVHVRRNLEKAVRGCTDLVLWLDCDREGEAIGFEVMHVCKSVQPRLRVRRARFSALIPRDIVHAVANLFEPDAKASDAVLARSECDLRLGAAFTRMQTLLLRDKFDGMPRMLSYGPCQFPTMWFVSQRAERISAFRPEDFWQIELSHRRTDEDGEEQLARFSWARYRLFDRLSCLVLYELCVARATAAVTSVAARPKSKMRPLPLATVELQMKASATLRISSDQTMKIAEELYQRGYLSYPRTETEKFKEGFDLHSMIRAQLADPRWGSYAQGLLDGGFVWPRPGSKDDNAHPPIHPVKCGADLSGDDAKLYEYVARRFLGCCSRDALGQETVVKVELAGELFTASGLMINERNYLDIFTYDRWTGRKIPYFYEGEHFEPHTLMMTSGTTTAPSPLTEAELIGLMERNGIGTDATIATHVKTILDREYVTKQQSSFHMTPVGSMLLKGYNDMPITNGKGVDIGKPELRAEMERTFDKVADGSMTKKEAIDHIIVGPAGMKYVFEAALKHQQVLLDTASALFSPVDTSRWARTRLGDGSSPACGTCDGPMGLFAESKPAAAGGGGGGGGGTNAFGDRSAPARSSLPRRALRCASCKVDGGHLLGESLITHH